MTTPLTIRAIIVEITPVSGILRPGKLARADVILDSKSLGRRMRPGMNELRKASFTFDITDKGALARALRPFFKGTLLITDSALLVLPGRKPGVFPLHRRYDDSVLERQRDALATALENVLYAPRPETAA